MPYFFNSERKATYISLTKACIDFTFHQLHTGDEIFQSFFPKASLKVKSSKFDMNEAFEFKILKTKNWVEAVLKSALKAVEKDTYPAYPPEDLMMAPTIARKLIETLIGLFSYKRDICADDYYFINDVTTAMNMDPGFVSSVIEKSLYQNRKEFFFILYEYLTGEERYKCALLIYHAIHADDYVHPAEYKYFEHINQLLDNDQIKLDQMRKESSSLSEDFKLIIDEELARYLFKTLTEIVMCDDDFEPRESEFIQNIAYILDFDKTRQDEIIQPVASAQMVKSALFPMR